VSKRSRLGRQREQAVEHGRDHVRVRDAVLLYQAQCLHGVPVVHDHQRHAVDEGDRHREGQRGGVVERTGEEVGVDAGLVVLVVPAEVDGGQRAHRGALAVHALGPTGGARRVEHLGAEDRVRNVGAVFGGHHGVVHLEAGDVAARVDLDQARAAGRRGDHDGVAQGAGADERLGLAVLNDVGRLLAGQVPVDRGEAQAGALGGVEHLQEGGLVGAHERDGVAGLESSGPQRAGQAVDLRVEVGEGARCLILRNRHTPRLPIAPQDL
jgi:hypothetical protein